MTNYVIIFKQIIIMAIQTQSLMNKSSMIVC